MRCFAMLYLLGDCDVLVPERAVLGSKTVQAKVSYHSTIGELGYQTVGIEGGAPLAQRVFLGNSALPAPQRLMQV